ncbi:MAG: PAS domain-containing protein, partial [Elusimicrobia bacterium]|nr:PAS domain-containing protein [Elusimicrobiota bacterium]
KKILRFETRHRASDGRIFPVQITANYLEFDGKEYNFAFIQDISERRQWIERIEQSQEMFRLVLDNIPQRVFWKDREFRYRGCNRPFLCDAGLKEFKEILGTEDFDLSWKESARAYREDDRSVMENDRPKLGFEEPQELPDGRVRWLRTNKLPLHDKGGGVIAVLGTYEEITEVKRAERALRFMQFAVDNCSLPVLWISSQGRILYGNQAACRRLACPAERLPALGVQDFDRALAPDRWGEFWRELKAKGNAAFRRELRAQDGRNFTARLSCSHLAHDGEELCFAFLQEARS